MADPELDDALGALAPYIADEHRSTIAVLVSVLRTGRQIESWLSSTLASDGLDTSEFTALSSLFLGGPPHRRSAGEIATSLVQTTGGTTKTVRRLEDRGLVRRVADPGDGRRSLVELTDAGAELANATIELVLDAFDLDIGGLDEAERTELGAGLVRLSLELGDRLGEG